MKGPAEESKWEKFKKGMAEREEKRKEQDPDGEVRENNDANVAQNMERMKEITDKATEAATEMMGKMS